MRFSRRLAAIALAALFVSPLALYAQFGGFFRNGPRFPKGPPDGKFQFARLMYDRVRAEQSGSGWTTDYPNADINFMIRFSELTKSPVSMGDSEDAVPNHVVVTMKDDRIFDYPFILASDAGTMGLSPEEIVRLRTYLLKGGFLWVDDSWGPQALEHFMSQISQVLPPDRYPSFEIEPGHALLRTMMVVEKVPQIPAISFWRRSGGGTSERGAETAQVVFRGIADEHGRIMVLISHNTDISDSWEREGEDPAYFYQFSPNGYAVGINAVLYSMTH